ncbi:ISL3 family transposase [Thermopolyspora sp. NPDC052614]|uniref:ISL3 family transposase n=1 Tax=Thermopolyspora sp. NPDC052614 TaxID=3155682 RepID=UPI00342D361B
MQLTGQPAGVACLKLLLPHLSCLVIDHVTDRGGHVLVEARTSDGPAGCPNCGMLPSRRHGFYRRRLQDLPAGGRTVLITLTVRRWKCENTMCATRTFGQAVNGLAVRYARSTSPLRHMPESLAIAVAARAASHLAGLLGIAVSRDTLIRLIRALPDPAIGPVTVLGIDDRAKRRGHSYATILINMATSRPIDILDDRTADAVTTWLSGHPEIQVIRRDRAGAYAEAATTGAPQATQVADRWHLWSNLCHATEKAVRAHRADLLEPEGVDMPVDMPVDVAPPVAVTAPATQTASTPHQADCDSVTATRTRQRHAIIHDLVSKGLTITAISRHLSLDRKTVRKYRDAGSAEEVINGPRRYSRAFAAFIPYLQQRVHHDGVTNAAQLFSELREHGHRGSRRTVRRYLKPLRSAVAGFQPPPAPLTVGQVTRWITSHPDDLSGDDKVRFKALLERSPGLPGLAQHVTTFAEMMIKRTGASALKTWPATVHAADIPPLRSFARGIERDLDAVINGLTLPYSSGAVEGNVTRVKALKRSRYGRANLDLLRKLILCDLRRR